MIKKAIAKKAIAGKAIVCAALFVAASGIVWAQSELNFNPSRVLGQPSLTIKSVNPNVVDGRSLFAPLAIAVDTTSTPPALFVSDTRNNRVLAWRNAAQFNNGAPADLVIGQLDTESTISPLGPGTGRTTGFNSPGALAVDRSGNLYVVDMGNNRILRFPKPFEATDQPRIPDFVIGQNGFTSGGANTGGISEKSIALTSSAGASTTGIAFDPQGNLWFSDSRNNRVLRYPRAALEAGVFGPAADLVLGEPDFKANNAPATQTAPVARLNKAIISTPTGLAVDAEGRVYVADGLKRVLVFAPPHFIGKEAVRILGVAVQQPNQPVPYQYLLENPEGLTIQEGRLVVTDAALHRIVRYDLPASWPAETAELPSPPATQVLGQGDFGSFSPNRGLSEPNASTVVSPFSVSAVGAELYVADSGNNRVLVFPTFEPTASATRLLGQLAFNYNSPNIVEGRELFLFNGFSANLSDGGGVALDNRSDPPRLYIADTYNNRILGYKDARKVRPNDPADIVIGQNDLTRTLVNAPQGDANVWTDSGLYLPTGLMVDSNGDLFVADSGNARVLRFPKPFEQQIPGGERHRANLVIGQRSATSKVTDASSRNLAYPFGLAFTGEGHLVVSDAGHHRVLMFRRPAGGDFVTGMPADLVIGQPDFFTVARTTGSNRFGSPRHIAIDTDDRLYVADGGNNRVLIFDRITAAGNDPPNAFTIPSLNRAQGVWVSPQTGEIWIANTQANRLQRFPRYERLTLGASTDYEFAGSTPLALTQDSDGNLYVAEAINRVAIYYNGLRSQIAGNYAERPLSPGAIGIVYPPEKSFRTFTSETVVFNELPNPIPLPKELADLQVLLDDRPLPLYFVSPNQINYLVPMDIATSGSAELQVIKKSAGQILAAGRVNLARVSPALFVSNAFPEGNVAAINQDGTINSPENPLPRGQVITLYGTGMGIVPGAPPEGTPPDGPTPGEEGIRVLIGPEFVPPDHIQYFGLAPGLVGVYQINVKVPELRAPSLRMDAVVQVRSENSNRGSGNAIIVTTIAVKE